MVTLLEGGAGSFTARKWILRWTYPTGNVPALERSLRTKIAGQISARVDPCRNATTRVVDARSYPMTAVGFHGRAATAESGKEEDNAEGV